MELVSSTKAVSRLWQQLNTPYSPGRRDGRRTAHLDILREGWAEWHDIEDVLWEMDSRSDVIARFNDDLRFLLDAFRLRLVNRYRGQFSGRREVYGHEALSAMDLAVLLMEVERLGFSVDAMDFIMALRPKLIRQRFLTESELFVLWHDRHRHRSEMLVIKSDLRPVRHETIKTHSGYRATALMSEADEAVIVRIDAPKRRGDLRLDWWINLGLKYPTAALR